MDAEKDLFDLPIEALLEIYVSSPSQSVKLISRAPNIITSVTGAQIQAMGASTLSGVLKMLPGVQILNRRNGRDMVWIRGIPTGHNSKVMLLIDGVPQREAVFGGWSADEQSNIDNIERIEVIRGPGSALYGGDAYSGMISIFTKSKVPEKTTVTAGIGSFDSKRLAINGGVQWQKSKLLYSASYYDTDGYPQQKDRRGFDSSHDNNVDATRLHAKYISEHWRFGLSYDNYMTEYPLYSSPQYKEQRYKILNGYVQHNTKFGKMSVENQLYRYSVDRRFNRSIVNPDGTENFSSFSDLNSHMTGLRSQWQYRFDEDNNVIFGAVYQNRDVAQYHETITLRDGLPDFELQSIIRQGQDRSPTADNYAVYLQHDALFFDGSLGLTAGIRYDHYELSGSELSPRLALTYQDDERWSGKLIWGTAFRAPTFLQQFEVRSDGNVPGNPALTPELIRTIEAEWIYNFDHNSNFALRGFKSTTNDFIQSTGGAPYQNINDSRSVPGFEVEYNNKWPLRWLASIELGLNFNYTRVNSNEPTVAKNNANLMLFSETKTTGLYVGLNYLGRRNDSSGYHSRVQVPELLTVNNKGSYTIVDIGIRFKNLWQSDWQMAVNAKNLLDKQHYNPTYAPDGYYDVRKQPRTFEVNLSYRF